MRHPLLWLEWAAYAVGLAACWWLLSKITSLLDHITRERRRRRSAQRIAAWRPPRHRPDPGDDETTVMPGIQRPKGP